MHLADDKERWRLLLDRHGPALLLLARQWSATLADAEDAVQEGFVRFWKTRGNARDESAYLFACVRSAAMDNGRGTRRRRKREDAVGKQHPGNASSFQPEHEQLERQTAIESALNQLPGDQREVVVLKIWASLTFAQIANALSISANTAASRYRYAMTKLHNELSEEVARDGSDRKT